jgi:hypothetical protein
VPPYSLIVHLCKGSMAQQQGGEPLVLGRGLPHLREDPMLSRQHCIIAFEPWQPIATVTWMGRREGRLRSRSRQRVEKITCGAQRTLVDGDTLALLADTGRHIALISIQPASATPRTRPDARSWALLEHDARADARAAARLEISAQGASAQALVDLQTAPPSAPPPRRPQVAAAVEAERRRRARAAAEEAPPASARLREVTLTVMNAAGEPAEDDEPARAQHHCHHTPQSSPFSPPPRATSKPTVMDLVRGSSSSSSAADALAFPSSSTTTTATTTAVAATAASESSPKRARASLLPPPPELPTAPSKATGGGVHHAEWSKGRARGLLRRRANEEQHLLDVTLVACPPRSAEEVCYLGMTVDERNVVTAVDKYGEASASGVVVGDKVRAFNGKPLRKRMPLEAQMRVDFIQIDDKVTLSIVRPIGAHVEHFIQRMTRSESEDARPPPSPRMLGQPKLDLAARRADYRSHPENHPYRDPYSGHLISHLHQWALGGSAGRMM